DFGAAPFDFRAMAIAHAAEKFVNRAIGGRERERFLDFARDPFLAMRHQAEALANGAQRGHLRGERPHRVRGNSTALANQLVEALDIALFLVALTEEKLPQLLLLDCRCKMLQRYDAGALRFEQQIEHLFERLVHAQSPRGRCFSLSLCPTSPGTQAKACATKIKLSRLPGARLRRRTPARPA